jgi:hypothetical protein
MAYDSNYEETQARRAEQEQIKQEGITILALINSAVAMHQHGLNIEDVKRTTLELLEFRDTTLFGNDSE